jgi:hypothetical protein
MGGCEREMGEEERGGETKIEVEE